MAYMQNSNAQHLLIADLIKNQSEILGLSVAVGLAKKVLGLSVSPSGEVIDVVGDPNAVLTQLVGQYAHVSGEISQAIFESTAELHKIAV